MTTTKPAKVHRVRLWAYVVPTVSDLIASKSAERLLTPGQYIEQLVLADAKKSLKTQPPQ